MKHMKRISSLALVLIMALCLVTTTFASEITAIPGPFTVTINNAQNHTYRIYQIFTGDLATTKDENNNTVEVLSNLKYGTDYVPEGKSVGDNAEIPENFDPATIETTGDGTLMTTNGDKATATGLAAGYYMIVDMTDAAALPDGEEPSKVIFQVVGHTEITSKHPTTTIEKKVQDINDTTGEYTADDNDTWIDSADYDINDTVPFKSTATFSGLENYTTYIVTFTDIMAPGLEYLKDMKVLVNGNDCTNRFDIDFGTYTTTEASEAAYNHGTIITVTCDDITELTTANEATIVLEYSAKLDSDAVLGAPGNPNKIKVTTKPDGTGETQWDVNIVFTFKVNVYKYTTVNGERTDLPGAGFTLYKQVNNENATGAQTGAAIKNALNLVNRSIKADALKDAAYYVEAAEVEVSGEGATFGFEGIDDGTYVLVETTIPAGYNAWNAVEFTVAATHDVTSPAPTLVTLTGGELFSGDLGNVNNTDGILSTSIENKAGVELPETGGIGTTIFYALGGIMVLVAVVLLVTKKRMVSGE